jgi:transposase
MSLQPHPRPSVPEDTARVARAAFPNGNPYLTLRDALGTVFQEMTLPLCFPRVASPACPRGASRW